MRFWRFLRSPKLALGVLLFLALYCGAAAWLPWQRPGAVSPPEWASALGLARPFSSPTFLAGTALLLLSTAVCTWDRTVRVSALWRGQVRPWGTPFPAVAGSSFEEFCRAEGFRGRGPVWFRARVAIWGGWLLHVGLLFLIAGILVQQGFHDGGAFELSEGESLRLDAPGAVFARVKGPFAPSSPPALAVALVAFDPFLHQKGYAPDRACVLRVEPAGSAPRTGAVDRAAGLDVGPVTVYQALPSGLCLNLEIEGMGTRSVHLREETHRRLFADVIAPDGRAARFSLESERHFDDPAGTGPLRVAVSGPGGKAEIGPGTAFLLGTSPARLLSIGRWGGFTYSRSPGIPAVFTGFALVILGAGLVTAQAGVAQAAGPGEDPVGWVWVSRGRDALLSDWQRGSAGEPGGGGS